MENNGWIKLHRKIVDWEWYTDINTTRLFLHLLLVANHTDGKWRGEIIKAGETARSLATLSEETCLSIQSIRTSIKNLKSTRELTDRKVKDYRVISITNYSLYQSTNTRTNNGITSDQHLNNIRSTHNKNDKNEKKEKKYIDTLTDYPKEEQEIADYTATLFSGTVRVTEAWSKNYERWRKVYSFEEIKKALDNWKRNGWVWTGSVDGGDLVLLFRTKNKAGECDYVGQLLNKKSKSFDNGRSPS